MEIGYTRDIYFITITVTDWIDIFTRTRYKQVVTDSLSYCQAHKGLVIYAWVLMTNHLHLIVGSAEDGTISEIIRDFKRHTSNSILRILKDDFKESRREWMLAHFHYDKKPAHFWHEGYYPEKIETHSFFIQKMNYIHDNPVRQGFVVRQEDYPYSSAINYAGKKGLLEVDTSCI